MQLSGKFLIFVSEMETKKTKKIGITENLFSEDKAIVAVKYEVSIKYVEMILRGARADKSETAQSIIRDLEMLACENIAWRTHKQNLIAA